LAACGGSSAGNTPAAKVAAQAPSHSNAAAIKIETASNVAVDQTLSLDILRYSNDLQWNGADAYMGKALTELQQYVRAVYHVNVFPGS
jgi:uncharacterized protein YfaQ (DUF2300 family)